MGERDFEKLIEEKHKNIIAVESLDDSDVTRVLFHKSQLEMIASLTNNLRIRLTKAIRKGDVAQRVIIKGKLEEAEILKQYRTEKGKLIKESISNIFGKYYLRNYRTYPSSRVLADLHPLHGNK